VFCLPVSFLFDRAGFRVFWTNIRTVGPITVTPFLLGGSEAVAVLALCIAALVMGRIEQSKFSEYGLP
jgi:hypothetical protein